MKTLLTFCLLMGMAVNASPTQGQVQSDLDKIYADESHCLVGPEIRGDKDNPISCFCRDAIVDARYVWHTYLITGKDRNLNGAELNLRIDATHMCGEHFDVLKAVETDDWKWNGPEVVRTYPPDDVLHQLTPDSHGMIHYDYTVVILQRDSSGHVIRTESFTAKDTVSARLLKYRSTPSAPKPQE